MGATEAHRRTADFRLSEPYTADPPAKAGGLAPTKSFLFTTKTAGIFTTKESLFPTKFLRLSQVFLRLRFLFFRVCESD